MNLQIYVYLNFQKNLFAIIKIIEFQTSYRWILVISPNNSVLGYKMLWNKSAHKGLRVCSNIRKTIFFSEMSYFLQFFFYQSAVIMEGFRKLIYVKELFLQWEVWLMSRPLVLALIHYSPLVLKILAISKWWRNR